MVNFGLNSASILGIFLAIAGASLYFMRSFRPELSRDQDIFFAAVGLLCGFILLFQGWRLDPILQFGQFLLTGMAVAFGVETIRLRGATTEQAKRSAPTVDRDRRTSQVYRAEIDDLDPYFEDEEPTDTRRRLRGTTSERPPRTDRYEEEAPRSTSSSSRRTRRKPSASSSRRPAPDYYYDDDEPIKRYPERDRPSRRDREEEETEDYLPPRRSPREEENPSRSRKPRTRPSTTGSKKRRTPSRPPSRRPSPPQEDYVDYRPIDSLDDEDDPNDIDRA